MQIIISSHLLQFAFIFPDTLKNQEIFLKEIEFCN